MTEDANTCLEQIKYMKAVSKPILVGPLLHVEAALATLGEARIRQIKKTQIWHSLPVTNLERGLGLKV